MTAQVTTDDDTRVIDLWGFVKTLWVEKWLWLGVFVLLAGAGATYALTRPPVYQATQAVVIGLPPATSQNEAIQQSNMLSGASLVFARVILMPPVTDSVLVKHPEIKSLEALRGRVEVLYTGNFLVEIRSRGADPAAEAALVRDLATSFRDQLPSLADGGQTSLRFVATILGDPAVVAASNGRNSLLVAAAALAALAATVVAALRAARRR